MRWEICNVSRIHFTGTDPGAWPHHHPGYLGYQHQPSDLALVPKPSPNHDMTAACQSVQHRIQMATQVKAVGESYDNHQERPPYKQDGSPGRPGINQCRITSYSFSPTISPKSPPEVVPTNAPTPTRPATQITPPIPVVTPSVMHMGPLTK